MLGDHVQNYNTCMCIYTDSSPSHANKTFDIGSFFDNGIGLYIRTHIHIIIIPDAQYM